MNMLSIEQTKSTPQVTFDPSTNALIIKGQSYPEDAFKFYKPVYEWLAKYIDETSGQITLEVELKLPYINSSSSKCIMMILDKLNDAFVSGKKVTVNWYYEEENESCLECAEEFKEDLTLPFNILQIDNI